MKLCNYGCGQLAIHQFKNGKWSCSKNYMSCPVQILKNRESKKGITHTKETKLKISNSLLGKTLSEEHKEKLRTINKKFRHTEESKLKISESHKGKTLSDEHKEKIRKSKTGMTRNKKIRKNMSIGKKFRIRHIKQRYPLFSEIEEMRYNPDKPNEKEIQVRCKNHKCLNSKENGGWYSPIHNHIHNRIRSIEKDGNDASYFYCSNKCKNECPLYNKRFTQIIKEDQIKAGIIKEEYYTSEEYNIFREEVLKRAEYKCEYCGEKVEHVHHIKPQKLEPFFSLDPDYGIACCKICHYEKGHRGDCSTGKIANKVCERTK